MAEHGPRGCWATARLRVGLGRESAAPTAASILGRAGPALQPWGGAAGGPEGAGRRRRPRERPEDAASCAETKRASGCIV